jgi:hypothetical protein
MDDRLYTTEELARYLKRSPRTIEDWRQDRKGPDYVRLPGGIRYRHADVQEWLGTNLVKVGQ